MNSATHPDPETLLRFADEDLPAGEADGVEQHLAACGECRDELATLVETSDEIRRFHQTVVKPGLPDPPRAWGPPRWIEQAPCEPATRRVLAFPVKRVLAVAAALIAAVVVVRWMDRPIAVSAAELLRKAEVREQATPDSRRRIRIRWKNHSWTRSGRVDTLLRPQAGDPAMIDAMLRQAGFDPEDPLTAAAFSRWRSGLAERHDEVRQEPESYLVTTSTPAGVLREASLTLRSGDLHAIRATLKYRSDETLDMDEVPAAAGELQVETPRPPVPERAPLPEEAPAAGIAEEVRVITALHAIGADLGEPVAVERSTGGIRVSGSGLAASRQEQIRAALSGIPGVRVTFEPGGGSRPNGIGLPPRAAAPADTSNPLLEQLRATGNAGADPGDALIDATDRAVQRAYALAALARRFPAALEDTLAPGDRAAVRAVATDHLDALSASLAGMTALLAPLLPQAAGVSPATAAWQESAESLVATARDVDQQLNATSDNGLETRKAQLGAALARMRSLVDTARTQLQ